MGSFFCVRCVLPPRTIELSECETCHELHTVSSRQALCPLRSLILYYIAGTGIACASLSKGHCIPCKTGVSTYSLDLQMREEEEKRCKLEDERRTNKAFFC